MSLYDELIKLRMFISNIEGLGLRKMILIYSVNFMIEVLTGTKLTSDFAIDALNTIYQENMK